MPGSQTYGVCTSKAVFLQLSLAAPQGRAVPWQCVPQHVVSDGAGVGVLLPTEQSVLKLPSAAQEHQSEQPCARKLCFAPSPSPENQPLDSCLLPPGEMERVGSHFQRCPPGMLRNTLMGFWQRVQQGLDLLLLVETPLGTQTPPQPPALLLCKCLL